MWLPKFFPTTQFHDSAKQFQNKSNLTKLLVELLLDHVGYDALLPVIFKRFHDCLQSSKLLNDLTCLADSCIADSMSQTKMLSFAAIIQILIIILRHTLRNSTRSGCFTQGLDRCELASSLLVVAIFAYRLLHCYFALWKSPTPTIQSSLAR